MADGLNVGNKKGTVTVSEDIKAGSDYIKIDSLSRKKIKVGDILQHGSNYYEVTSVIVTIVYIKPNLKSNLSARTVLDLYEKGEGAKITKETKKILISYNTETIEDPNKWEDYKHTQPGENGYYFEEWEVKEYSDGRTERTKLRTYGRVEPKDSIITVGTKPINSTDYRYEEKPAETIEEKVVEDESIYVGKEEVIKGTADTLKLTYLRHYKKGVFTHEELVDTRVIKKGTPTIIKKGTKKYPYLWRRLKVIRTTGEVEYTGHELINSHTKDIQKLDSYFKGYQKLTDKEFKRTLEKIESQKSIIDGKFSETRTSINKLKETSESAIRDITSTVESKLSGYTSVTNTRFEQMNGKFGLYVTESTYNKDKSSYESKFSSIEQKSNRIELSIAGKTDSSDVRNIFTSLELTDKQIKSVTDKFVIESRSGTYRNEMKWGNFTSYKDGYKQFEVNRYGMKLFEKGEEVSQLSTGAWSSNGSKNFRMGHRDSSMTISYHNSKADAFSPYITFDKYNTSGTLASSDYPIKISDNVYMNGNFWVKPGYRLRIGDTYYLQSGTLHDGNAALYLTRDNGKYGLALVWNKLYFIKDHTLYEIFKA